ncbi:hypothetical protein [Streptomyces hainanensis]|uniref:Uncharacterized protein n=1 Tax=Streptomyces hainanensis TaxID=402648 RepID=A0A4R4TAR2_9ACTN|nr:hypothetical protein [Streptomyces hainanensis]TDC74280.1 hypothetical protein E1283_16235 [Streptomyces hainanensis]
MTLGDRVLGVLASEARETFLLALGHRLGIEARQNFLGEDASDALPRARACNEMMIVIWSQLWAGRGAGDEGYPDRDFLTALSHRAQAGDAREQLAQAVRSALLAVTAEAP